MNGKSEPQNPRGHHYIPQCYLKYFTENCNKEEHLWVIDSQRSKIYKGTPKEVANRRDFFKVDSDATNGDSYYFEKELGYAENQFEEALNTIHQSHSLPPKGSNWWGVLFWHMAKIHATGPTPREWIHRRQTEALTQEIIKRLPDEDVYRQMIAEVGMDISDPDMPNLKQFKGYIDRKDIVLNFDQSYQISSTWELIPRYIEIFEKKHWYLLFIENLENNLITSDVPLAFQPQGGLSVSQPPDYSSWVVTFPLTKEILLVGSCLPRKEANPMSKEKVAQQNSIRLLNADSQTFLPTNSAIFFYSENIQRLHFAIGSYSPAFTKENIENVPNT